VTGIVAAGSATVSSGETATFWVLAFFSVLGALGMVLSRKAVHSALYLALTMICLAFLYVAQQAPFLGVVQVVVYTGAVMMLFLFVLMLVGVDASDSLIETIRGQRIAALVLGIGFGGVLVAALGNAVTDQVIGLEAVTAADGGNVQALARLIFGRYVVAFELTSALLITAALGAMVLAHRERLAQRPSQRALSEQRFATPGARATPMPAPGVYARHNAVDTPGLLPDGSPAEESVPAPLLAGGTERTFRTADGRTVASILGGRSDAAADAADGTDPADESKGGQA
jgi:NADH-quinone oxidoreductase subunit J